jgi:hypothetical protein
MSLPSIEIPAIQAHLNTWNASISTYQAEHWGMQTRGHFNRELYDRVLEEKNKLKNQK